MDLKRGYLIVPKLIEQPTWGGDYIVKFKGLKDTKLNSLKIGQSYELYSGSKLSQFSDPAKSFNISDLINLDSNAVLGKKTSQKFNGQLKTLIKFTQAKGNSYQLHIKPNLKSDKWQAKPESWYFFEQGLATIGVKDLSRINEYKNTCIQIDLFMHKLSSTVKNGTISITDARQKAKEFIKKSNISQFVNLIKVPKEGAIDLSQGGLHHSWEEDKNQPLGNVLYEVQLDVMDDISTIRSFDQGKLKDNGDIRELHIEDYFKHLDKSIEANSVKQIIRKPIPVKQNENYAVEEIFNTEYYSLQKLTLSGILENEYTSTKQESFHHLFALSGDIQYVDSQVKLNLAKGHSIFVPAHVNSYKLTGKAEVLKTFI